MPTRFDGPIAGASTALAAASDPDKAAAMAAYLKTDMPFFGVQKSGRAPVIKALVADAVPANQGEYCQLVTTLWNLPHREEKYLALAVAEHFASFHVPASLDLFELLITEGAWWDLVDHAATRLVGATAAGAPEAWERIDPWIDSEDMWLRRSALICQIKAKSATDRVRLARYCRTTMHEKEFFIRKAIGWALREYAKTDPDWVWRFTSEYRDSLSPLSYREATKHF